MTVPEKIKQKAVCGQLSLPHKHVGIYFWLVMEIEEPVLCDYSLMQSWL